MLFIDWQSARLAPVRGSISIKDTMGDFYDILGGILACLLFLAILILIGFITYGPIALLIYWLLDAVGLVA